MGWSLYLPQTWDGALDTTDGAQATIRTGREERFVISLEPNPSTLSIDTWLAQRTVPSSTSVATTTLRAIPTKGGLRGFLSADRMTAAFGWGDQVFVLKYELRGQAFVNLRTFFEMMMNSLRLSGAPVVTSTLTPATSGPGALIGTTSSSTEVVPPVTQTTSSEAIPPPVMTTSTTTTTSEIPVQTTTTQP